MTDKKLDIIDLLSKIDNDKLHAAMSAPSKITDPMYTADDLVNSPDSLTQLVRYLFIEHCISKNKFRDMHKRYCNRCGILSSDATTKFNNNLRTLIEKRITWRTFTEDVLPVLGLHVKDVILVLGNDNGVVSNISLTDVRRKVSNNFPNDIPNLKEFAVTVSNDKGEIRTIKQENINGENPRIPDNKGA